MAKSALHFFFIIKFRCDSPTRRHMHAQDVAAFENNKCPACLHIVETDWHILTSPYDLCGETQLSQSLKDTFEGKSYPLDLTMILSWAHTRSSSDPGLQMPVANREPGFHNLLVVPNGGNIPKADCHHRRTTSTTNQTSTTLNNQANDKADWSSINLTSLRRMAAVTMTHGRDKTERERKKRLEKLTPRVVAIYTTHSWTDSLPMTRLLSKPQSMRDSNPSHEPKPGSNSSSPQS
jgi:hypothetical protein